MKDEEWPLFFSTGVSVLEGKEDVFEDWREKFFNTYKVGHKNPHLIQMKK